MSAWLLAALLTNPTPVSSRDAVASQLGDVDAQLRYAPNGRLSSARGALGVVDEPADYVRDRAAVLDLRGDEQFVVLADEIDAHGNRHLRVTRRLFGLPVAFDQIRIHATPSGAVYALQAETAHLGELRYRAPAFPPAHAVQTARGGFAGPLTQSPQPTLVVVGPGVARIPEARLAYRVRIAYERPGQIPVVRDIYVDAHRDEAILVLSGIYTQGTAAVMTSDDLDGQTVSINVVDFTQSVLMQDAVTIGSGGQIITVDAGNNNNIFNTPDTLTPFTDPSSVSVHHSVRQVVDYFETDYQWNRWDFSRQPAGVGGNLAAAVHEGDKLNNAYFSTATAGSQTYGYMAFGDGDGTQMTSLARCLDIAAHEMGHGVVQATANLAYQFQSGALNEHIADVFGWLMDPGDDLIGEDCVGAALMPALRDMCQPDQVPGPQPAHMNGFVTLPNTENGDWGGVHVNSGIPNRASCVAQQQIGLVKVGQVWFQTLRFHLGPNSTFDDMVTGTATACSELSLAAMDCANIASAWASVGLGFDPGGGPCPTNSTANSGVCFCDAGFTTNAAGTGCEPVATLNCPPNSSPMSGSCYCDVGFRPNSSGTGCVPSGQAGCPSNSHLEGTTCVCDPCFQGNPNTGGSGCTPITGCVVCNDPLERASMGACECIAGISEVCGDQSFNYMVNIMGTDYPGEVCCRPGNPCGLDGDGTCDCFGQCGWDTGDCGSANLGVPECRARNGGDCGNENWTGRCEGDWLIYCDDQTDPMNPYVQYGDCTQLMGGNFVCGFDQTVGYNCIENIDNCGTVPDTGVCNGNSVQYCQGGNVQTVNCGNYPCGPTQSGGMTIQYCLPCVLNASLVNAICECDVGFEWNATRTACAVRPPPEECTCDVFVGCEADCPCDPDCAECTCDVSTACDPDCPCDFECGSGCGAVHVAARPAAAHAAGWMSGLLLLTSLMRRRRRP